MSGRALIFFLAILVSPVCGQPIASEEGEAPEDTPVMFEDSPNISQTAGSNPWKEPDYSGQDSALGYLPNKFNIPKGMEDRVQFWVDIYTKYTTDQGILHDSKYVHLVYESLDFNDIMKDESLTFRDRERARRKRVDDTKRQIKQRLERLQTLKGPEGLEGEDLRYWNLFEKVDEKNKFKEAGQRGRLRFQLGQRDRFISGIVQSGRYLAQMEKIFTEFGLPRELTRLPFVESSFNLKARSKVGASGIWQFMRSTARQYMKLNYSVDERNDPIAATRAAARKMKENFQMLETWPIAVTAYNHGPSGMRRLVRKFGTSDIAELTDVRKGRFGFASASFYASFLAAVEVEKNAAKYFGPINRLPPLEGTEIILERNISLSRLLDWFSGDQVRAQDFNPHLQSYLWASQGMILKKNFIRVPADLLAKVQGELKTLPEETVAMNEGLVYPVMRGDTLSDIADKFRIPIRLLMDTNAIGDPRRLREGQKLIIPPK